MVCQGRRVYEQRMASRCKNRQEWELGGNFGCCRIVKDCLGGRIFLLDVGFEGADHAWCEGMSLHVMYSNERFLADVSVAGPFIEASAVPAMRQRVPLQYQGQ